MEKNRRTLRGDVGVMQRESAMAMATIASLGDDELSRTTACAGWSRAHVIAHLALGADATTDLVRWATTGETPASTSLEQRDAAVDAAARSSATELTAMLRRADERLVAAFRELQEGVQVETVATASDGGFSVFWLPARRTTEVIVHHSDLDTTWEWDEADPDAMLDAIEVCVRRLQLHPESPGLRIVAHEGEQWTVGDGGHRVEGYYESLLPYLAREQVRRGLRHDAELPSLPPW